MSFHPEAILLIGCQALLGCGCVVRLLSVNTAQRAHDWASSNLTHTHTHTSSDKKLVKVCWMWEGSTLLPVILPPAPPGPSDSDRHVYIPPSVSQVTQSGVQLPPNHRLPPSPAPSPRVKAPGCQTLIACSNNICTFNIMAVLKCSLCSKCSEQGGEGKEGV